MIQNKNQDDIFDKISSYQEEKRSKNKNYYDIGESDIFRMQDQLDEAINRFKIISHAYHEKLLNRHNQDLIDLELHISTANAIMAKTVKDLEEIRITYPIQIQLQDFDETYFEIQCRDHMESLFIHYEPELYGYLCMKKQSLVVEKERLQLVINGLRKEFIKVGADYWDEHSTNSESLKVPEKSFFLDKDGNPCKVGEKIGFDKKFSDHSPMN